MISVFAAEQKNAKLQSELRKMDSDFENELKERETIVDDLKKIETEKKDLEIALEEAKKELADIQSESNKNKQEWTWTVFVTDIYMDWIGEWKFQMKNYKDQGNLHRKT